MQAICRPVVIVAMLISCGVMLEPLHTLGQQPQSKSLAGERLHLSIALGADGFRLTQLRDKVTGYEFEADDSLLWQATLRDADRPARFPLGQSVPDDRTSLRAATCRWGRCTDRQLELIYEDIPIPGQEAQSLNGVLRVRVRDSDGQLVWSCSTTLQGRGSYVIHDVKFPLLSLGPIGAESADDQLILPAWGGLYVPDPIHTGNNQDDGQARLGDNARDSLTYPGYVESQFMAYCDPASSSSRSRSDEVDEQLTGLWMTCEDALGYTKRLMFQGDPERNRVHLFFRHFNYAEFSSDRSEVIRSLQRFEMQGKMNYAVAMDSFAGDWVDAAALYRRWLDREKPIFLRKGTLRQRNDMPQSIRESQVVLGYLPNKTPNTPITSDLSDPNSDLSKIKRMMDFVSFDQRDEIHVDIGFGGGTKENPSHPGTYGGIGGDAFPPKLHRQGMPQLIQGLHKLGAATIVFNRDIGNWQMTRDVELDQQAVRKGLVINFDGQTYGKPQPNFSVSCGSSVWINEARIPTTVDFVLSSRVNGKFGYNDGILSGKGPGARLCWAALHPQSVDLNSHRHQVGGGNDWVVQLRMLAENLQEILGPRYWPTGERGHEQQVDWSRLGGRHRYWPWDVTFPGTLGQWIEGAQPVPIRSYLFHHFCPLGSMGLPRTVMVKTYQRGSDLSGLQADQLESARWRFRYADVLQSGERLGLFVASGGPVARSLDKRLDGTVADVYPSLQKDLEYFRRLVRIRAVARDLLCYGRMERPPHVDCDSTTMPFLGAEDRRQKLYRVDIPNVLGSAWMDRNKPGFVFVNHAQTEQTFSFTFNAAEMGLDDQSEYEWEQTDEWNWRSAELTFDRDEERGWRSSALTLPAGESLAIRLR